MYSMDFNYAPSAREHNGTASGISITLRLFAPPSPKRPDGVDEQK